jgi:hypothetical protein
VHGGTASGSTSGGGDLLDIIDEGVRQQLLLLILFSTYFHGQQLITNTCGPK